MDDWFKNLWEKNKILFYLVIPLLLLIKFRELIINLLISSSKTIYNSASQKDKQLQDEANSANQQADQILKESESLDSQKKPVSEDWYKKD